MANRNNTNIYKIATFRYGLFILVTIISGLWLKTDIASASEKVFIKEYTYQASDIDSKVSSRVIALEQIKRLLLEELGTYLISETEVKNFNISKDQITILTAGIVKTTILEDNWDGKSYYLKAKLTADSDQVAKTVDALRHDKERSKELSEAKKTAEEALNEIGRLKNMLGSAQSNSIQQMAYKKAVNELSASELFYQGFTQLRSNNYKEAISAFNKAVDLNPNNAEAYSNRGLAYNNLGNYEMAIRDYERAIFLKPKYAQAYYLLGIAHKNTGDIKQAIQSYEQSIDADPLFAEAYYKLGVIYMQFNINEKLSDMQMQSNINKGIQYLNMAIKLGSTQAKEYMTKYEAKWTAAKLEITHKENKTTKIYTIRIGSEIAVPNTKVKIKVLAFLPDFLMGDKGITTASNKPNNPAAQVVISEPGKKDWKAWIYSTESVNDFETPRVRI